MKNWKSLVLSIVCCALAAAFTGCARNRDLLAESFQPVYAPLPPDFLTGSIGQFLGQQPDFSARVETTGEPSATAKRITGQLFGSNRTLVFAPDPDPEIHQETPEEIFTFIWNTATRTGYVLIDALQGYAPVTYSSMISTNITAAPADVQVIHSEGQSKFPVQLSAGNLNVKLSKLRLRTPETDLVEPPKDFTKYSSPEIMAQELALRRHNLKREVR